MGLLSSPGLKIASNPTTLPLENTNAWCLIASTDPQQPTPARDGPPKS
jgi:hypothetical protein